LSGCRQLYVGVLQNDSELASGEGTGAELNAHQDGRGGIGSSKAHST